MQITLSGKLGSGKSTLCSYLKENYGFIVYSAGKLQRETAKELGISILELNQLQQADSHYDHIVDNKIKQISEEYIDKNIIFDSRIAFYLLPNSLKVYLTVDPLLAAQRIYEDTKRGEVEHYETILDAQRQIELREQAEILKFKSLYLVDISDMKNYDLIIDSSYCDVQQVAKQIMNKKKGVKVW